MEDKKQIIYDKLVELQPLLEEYLKNYMVDDIYESNFYLMCILKSIHDLF